jgi:C4-dicarboxylate-specific signal transduction histidine kinase
MGELTTSIAHEVKQPLFAIVSNAQTATRMLDQEQPDLPEIREALSDIASDGNRASDIIDHIRSLVRKEDHPKKRVDLNEVASEVIKLVRPELRKRGLTVRSELANSLPEVQGDQIELQQVILNLIINGAQAMSHATVQRVSYC